MTEIKSGQNQFYIEEADEVIARIEFTNNGADVNGKDLITVTHTIVNEGHNGKGLAKQLVQRIAEYAKDENKLIIPQCSYAKKVLESNSEYQDILAN